MDIDIDSYLDWEDRLPDAEYPALKSGNARLRVYEDEDAALNGLYGQDFLEQLYHLKAPPPPTPTTMSLIQMPSLKTMARLPPNVAPAKSPVYRTVILALDRCRKKGVDSAWGNLIQIKPNSKVNLANLYVIFACGDSRKGCGHLPDKIRKLLEETGLCFMLVDIGQRIVPQCYNSWASINGLTGFCRLCLELDNSYEPGQLSKSFRRWRVATQDGEQQTKRRRIVSSGLELTS